MPANELFNFPVMNFLESIMILVKINTRSIIKYSVIRQVPFYLINNQLMKTNYKVLLTLLSMTACRADIGSVFGSSSNDGSYPNVDKALWPYFERFEVEGAKRGLTVYLKDASITGVISDISAEHVIGQCSYSNQDPHKVTIDLPFWNSTSDLGKEFVVFHELGHCYLGRLHDESTDSRGICLSIMRSGTGTCRDMYSTTSREKLIDELFEDKN